MTCYTSEDGNILMSIRYLFLTQNNFLQRGKEKNDVVVIKSRLQKILSFLLNLFALGKRSKVLLLVTSSNNVIILSRLQR